MPDIQKKNKHLIKQKIKHVNPIKEKDFVSKIPEWAPIAIIVFTAIIYLKALFNDFASLDDDMYILKNPFIRDFSLDGVKAIFSSFYCSNYHPLTSITYLFEYKFFGLAPFPYHFTNVILHLVNTFIVYKLIKKLSTSKITALVVTSLFALHPMHVESVAWISERKDVLYSFFYLFSLLVYMRYIESGFKLKYYTSVLILFILSLLSKSAAVTLPVLLIVIDIYKGRKINAKTLLEKIPFFMLSMLFGIIALFSQRVSDTSNELFLSYNFIERIFLFSYTISFYIVKLALPFSLCAMHYLPINNGGILPWYYYASLPFILFIIFILVKYVISDYKKKGFKKEIIFGILFFLITISVMLQIISVGNAITAERYTYIPYIGLFYIAGQWISNIVEKRQDSPVYRKGKKVIIAIFLLFVIMFSYQTWTRIGVWKDGNILFTDVIKKNPDVFHCYWTRGKIKNNNGNLKDALPDYNKAIELQPEFADAYNNRGYIYYGLGDTKSALIDYNKALLLKPDFADAYNNRGIAYEGLGDINSAILDYNKAILLEPDKAESYNNRGYAYYRSGDLKSAISDYNKAVILDSKCAEAYINRGIAFEEMGNVKSALPDYNKAIMLNPKLAMAYKYRCLLKIKTKDLRGAMEDINMSIVITPEDAETYSYRGIIKVMQNDYKGAIEDFCYSIKLKPNVGKVYYNCGVARLYLKDNSGACEDWKKAIELGYGAASQMVSKYCDK
ncbi:MAG: tetratricopeptide repeat protein [Bacteroidetes bacterium]|nr:tetratricopeptide repeat protein [Bacteroidota bacterium]